MFTKRTEYMLGLGSMHRDDDGMVVVDDGNHTYLSVLSEADALGLMHALADLYGYRVEKEEPLETFRIMAVPVEPAPRNGVVKVIKVEEFTGTVDQAIERADTILAECGDLYSNVWVDPRFRRDVDATQ
jgi:hypothetical protein